MLNSVAMRALPLNSTVLVLAALLIFSLVTRGSWERIRRILSHPAMVAFLLTGAVLSVAFSALTGYINPRDYVQDAVAARQFLKHRTMYPVDLPQLGSVELSAPIPGEEALERIPVVRAEFATVNDPPAPFNAHPPLLGILLAAPVVLLGLRGSFLFVFFLSFFLLFVSVRAILRELFPPLPFAELTSILALVVAWYPVGATFRAGQPSIFLFALVTAGWLMLRRERFYLAGGAIGLAACLHAFPALLILYFAFRRWKAFLAAVGAIAVLNLIAVALTAPGSLARWLNTMRIGSRPFTARPTNFSAAGLVSSFLGGMGWGEHPVIVAPVMVLIGAGALTLFLHLRRHRPDPDVEYSVFVAAMLLASPIFWARYLPILLLSLAVLIRNWSYRSPSWAIPALLAALVCLSFPDSTILAAHQWLSIHIGFPANWIERALPTFSTLAIVVWLARSQTPNYYLET